MPGARREIEFLGTLGQGGFGSVYLANLRSRDGFVRRVAVKVMREGLESKADLLARQRDEARLLGRLAHEQIVQVLDLTEVEGRPAVIMEYVEGVDVAEISKSVPDRRLPPRAALEIVAAAASALDAAWNSLDPTTGVPLRVVHRDIKPANLFVTKSGGVKVLDFGIARSDGDREGVTGSVAFGTPRFMAPEQWLQEPYGGEVDVYALGVSLYEMVGGRAWERPALVREAFDGQVDTALAAIDADMDVKRLIREMTSFEGDDRPLPAAVHLRALELTERIREHPLAIWARRVVPPLVRARAALLRAGPLPGPISLESDPLGTDASATFPDAPTRGVSLRSPVLAALGVFTLVGLAAAAAAAWVVYEVTSWDLDLPDEAEPVGVPAAAVPVEPAKEEPEPAETTTVVPVPERAPQPAPSVRTPVGRPPEPEPTPPVDTPPPEPKEEATPAEPPKAEAPTWPFIVTDGAIGASVKVDGKDAGTTPTFRLRLPEGDHTVVVERDGEPPITHQINFRPAAHVGVTCDFGTRECRDTFK